MSLERFNCNILCEIKPRTIHYRENKVFISKILLEVIASRKLKSVFETTFVDDYFWRSLNAFFIFVVNNLDCISTANSYLTKILIYRVGSIRDIRRWEDHTIFSSTRVITHRFFTTYRKLLIIWSNRRRGR